MFKTETQILVLCLSMVVIMAGCAKNGFNTAPIPAIPVSQQQLVLGNEYKIVTYRASDGAKVSYQGVVEEANDSDIVISGATRSIVVEQTSQIPVVGQLFKNKSLDYQKLNGNATVRRSEVSEIKDMTPPSAIP